MSEAIFLNAIAILSILVPVLYIRIFKVLPKGKRILYSLGVGFLMFGVTFCNYFLPELVEKEHKDIVSSFTTIITGIFITCMFVIFQEVSSYSSTHSIESVIEKRIGKKLEKITKRIYSVL